MNATLVQHIEMTPGVVGGKPRIAGTRIRVADVALPYEAGTSVPEILEWFPHISESDVHAAIAFYCDNRELIDGQDEDERNAEEWFRRAYPHLVHEPPSERA